MKNRFTFHIFETELGIIYNSYIESNGNIHKILYNRENQFRIHDRNGSCKILDDYTKSTEEEIFQYSTYFELEELYNLDFWTMFSIQESLKLHWKYHLEGKTISNNISFPKF